MNRPLVSIIIPVYNGGSFLRECIDSALAQTYEEKEIIVVNDGSSDGGKTEEIALSYGDKIKYVSKENGGVSSALNKGIEVMNGEYFSWLSHDDKYKPDKVKNSVELLEKYGFDKKLIAYTGTEFIDENSNLLKKKWPISFDKDRIIKPDEVMTAMLRYGALSGCALLISKSAFEECGVFDEDLRFCQDLLMWYRIFGKGYSIVADGVNNVFSRLHSNQVTQTRQDLYYSDCQIISDELMGIFLSQENKQQLFGLYISDSAKRNVYSVARKCLAKNRELKILSFKQHLRIGLFFGYGKLRIILKKVYYKLIYKVEI